MEDADEKIRRNLLLVSTIVLIVWILDFKVTSEVTLFNVVETVNFSARKFWSLAGLLLIYFGLRYRFDPNVIRKLAAVKQELETEYLIVASSSLEKAFRAEIDCSAPGLRSVSFGHALLNEHGEPKGKFVPVLLDFDSFWRATGTATFSGMVVNQYGEHGISLTLPYTLSGFLRFKATALSVMRLTAYSQFGIEVLLPIILSSGALAVCAVKVVGS